MTEQIHTPGSLGHDCGCALEGGSVRLAGPPRRSDQPHHPRHLPAAPALNRYVVTRPHPSSKHPPTYPPNDPPTYPYPPVRPSVCPPSLLPYHQKYLPTIASHHHLPFYLTCLNIALSIPVLMILTSVHSQTLSFLLLLHFPLIFLLFFCRMLR